MTSDDDRDNLDRRDGGNTEPDTGEQHDPRRHGGHGPRPAPDTGISQDDDEDPRLDRLHLAVTRVESIGDGIETATVGFRCSWIATMSASERAALVALRPTPSLESCATCTPCVPSGVPEWL